MDPGVQLTGSADQFHAFCRGNMLDTQRSSGPDGKFHIPLNQGDLCFAGRTGQPQGLCCLSPAVDPVLGDQSFILLMEADGQIQAFCRQQGFFQDRGVHHGNTVIRKACGAGGRQGVKIHGLFALHALRDIGAAVQMDLLFFCACQNI